MIHTLRAFSDNYMYAIESGSGGVVIIDPSEAAPVIAFCTQRQLTPVALWCTHHHADHVSGTEALLARYGKIPVVAGAYDLAHARIGCQTLSVNDGDWVPDTSLRAKVIGVPGHTLGAVAYLVGNALFTGDTLFLGGCGRLFEGTPAQMFASLSRLQALPDDTLIYCGHEYALNNLKFAQSLDPSLDAPELRAKLDRGEPSVPDTLGNQKRWNPMLRAADVAAFTEVRKLRDAW